MMLQVGDHEREEQTRVASADDDDALPRLATATAFSALTTPHTYVSATPPDLHQRRVAAYTSDKIPSEYRTRKTLLDK